MPTQSHGNERHGRHQKNSTRMPLGKLSPNAQVKSSSGLGGSKHDKLAHKVTNGSAKVTKGSSPSSQTSSSTSPQDQQHKDASHYRLHFSGELIPGRSPLAGSNMSSSVNLNTPPVLEASGTDMVFVTQAKFGNENVRARITTEHGRVTLHRSKAPGSDLGGHRFPMELGNGDEKIKVSNPEQNVLVIDLQALDGRRGFSAILGLGPGGTHGLPLFDTILAQEGRAEAFRHNTLTMDISPWKPIEGSKTDFKFNGYNDIGVVDPDDSNIQWIQPSGREILRDAHSVTAWFLYGGEVLGDRVAHGHVEIGPDVTVVKEWLFDALKAKLIDAGIEPKEHADEKMRLLRLSEKDFDILNGEKRCLEILLKMKDGKKVMVSQHLTKPRGLAMSKGLAMSRGLTIMVAHSTKLLESMDSDFLLGISFLQSVHDAGKQIVIHNPTRSDKDIQPCVGFMPRTERSRREEVTQTGSVTKKRQHPDGKEQGQSQRDNRPWVI